MDPPPSPGSQPSIHTTTVYGPIAQDNACHNPDVFFLGPGPGTYALPPLVGPNTAPNKQSAPQWTVKLPLKTKYNDAPAPSYVPADNKVPAATVKGRNFYNPSKFIYLV